jgi:hypothetical protein
VQRFVENDLISPDADRLQILSQTCAVLITGGLFVSILLSLPYLTSPYPMPGRTAANMIRVQFLYSAWSMTVMALVAVSAWDSLALDYRDTQILGPLPLRRPLIIRTKISALIMFAAAFAAALNVVPALIHPIVAVSRLRPTIVQVGTLIAAHIVTTTAAAAFGFAVVLATRELLHAALGTTAFRRISVLVRAALVVVLVTTLLLIPVTAFRVANLWLQGAIDSKLVPPMWFAGLHDIISGHIWAQLPRPYLPPSVAAAERSFEFMYQTRQPLLHQLGLAGGGTFLLVLLISGVAYLWNNRRLPQPPISRTADRGYFTVLADRIALLVVARQPLVRAGFFFTARVLARSVHNRLSVGIPLAVAIAVATVSLLAAGVTITLDFSKAPIAVLAVQLLFVTALVAGFRHSIRVPPDLRARWVFHLIRPRNQATYLRGAKRAAFLKLLVPILLALLPFHMFALDARTAVMHLVFGLVCALVLSEASLLDYRRLPFAASYVPEAKITTHGGIYAFAWLISVYTVAWSEHVALSTRTGTIVLFGVSAAGFGALRGIDLWQRQQPREVELDEQVDPPTLRLGLMD